MKAVLQWVLRTMMKDQTGIVQTMPKKDLVDFNVAMTAERLMRNGFDPNAFKNANQVENAINQIDNAKKVDKGITSAKSADVFDLKGKKIKDTDNIMGGEELPPLGSRGGDDDIAAPIQSAEESIKDMIEAENKKAIESLKQKMKKEEARSKRISGNLRESNRERFDRIQFGKEKKGPPVKGVDYDYYRELLDYQGDEFSDDIVYVVGDETEDMLKAMVKEAEDEVAYMKRLYDKGVLDPKPGQKYRKEFLDRKAQKGDKMTPEEIEELKKLSEDPDEMAQGGRAGFSKGSGLKSLFNFLNENNPVQAYKKYLESVKTRMKAGKEAEVAGEVIPIAAGGALITNQMKKVLKKMNEEQKKRIEEEAQEELRKDMKKADGGIMRLGLKEGTGMTRRTFLKILGGAMSIPIIGKFLAPMKVGKTVTKVPMIKTDNVAGKPEWFDALVNKVIIEGDDVTKKFATGERQSIHQKTLDDGSVVRVTEDIDDGAVRVEYESYDNVFEDPVQLQYKKPLPDEGDPRPTAEFTTAESGPVGRSVGPDDFEIDVDEVGGTSIRDLDSDVSKLKEYATGKKPTMKELVQNIERRKRARQITEDSEAQMDSIIRRQGDADDSYYGDPDEFASGGIARLLGE